jgi:hypothetical protein
MKLLNIPLYLNIISPQFVLTKLSLFVLKFTLFLKIHRKEELKGANRTMRKELKSTSYCDKLQASVPFYTKLAKNDR